MDGAVDAELADSHSAVLVLGGSGQGQAVDGPRAHGQQGGVGFQVLVPGVAADNGVRGASAKIC